MRQRIVVVGGGFGGTYTAVHLEKLSRRQPGLEVTLISRDNFYLMTPLLFEAASGRVEPRHAVNPIRPLLRRTRFLGATVTGVDVERKVVHALDATGEIAHAVPYDQLVLALGSRPNYELVPGSEKAMSFKTISDAIELRNHVINQFERAEIEADLDRRRELLQFVVVGGGLVGVELTGELAGFVRTLRQTYRSVAPSDIGFDLIEAGPRILPELDEALASYASRVLQKAGVRVRVGTSVKRIQSGSRGAIDLPGGEQLRSSTILYAAGNAAHPLVDALPLEKDRKRKLVVDETMRSRSHPDVWALGDCAAIPDPKGQPYPPLAQHALREAKRLADNLVRVGEGHAPRPFVYSTRGTLALLGDHKGVGRVFGIPVRGLLAWWLWRTYYLFQMPRWERRLRIMIDWTVASFFKPDTAQLTFHTPPPALRSGSEAVGLDARRAEEALREQASPVPPSP